MSGRLYSGLSLSILWNLLLWPPLFRDHRQLSHVPIVALQCIFTSIKRPPLFKDHFFLAQAWSLNTGLAVLAMRGVVQISCTLRVPRVTRGVQICDVRAQEWVPRATRGAETCDVRAQEWVPRTTRGTETCDVRAHEWVPRAMRGVQRCHVHTCGEEGSHMPWERGRHVMYTPVVVAEMSRAHLWWRRVTRAMREGKTCDVHTCGEGGMRGLQRFHVHTCGEGGSHVPWERGRHVTYTPVVKEGPTCHERGEDMSRAHLWWRRVTRATREGKTCDVYTCGEGGSHVPWERGRHVTYTPVVKEGPTCHERGGDMWCAHLWWDMWCAHQQWWSRVPVPWAYVWYTPVVKAWRGQGHERSHVHIFAL